MNNILSNQAVFQLPERIVQPHSWVFHIPFAFYLVDIIKPKTIVELGIHSGNSYFAFCQAVKQSNCNTVCFGIDHWKGDKHAGNYDEEIFNDVHTYNQDHYSDFSYLIKKDFDDALTDFSDFSIDLLHIDGLHTYERVKHDFESWLPKLSKNAIVLLHDVNVRRDDFGVWKFFDELSKEYYNTVFNFGYGLGLIYIGNDIDNESINNFLKDIEDGNKYLFRLLGERISYIARYNDLTSQYENEKKQTSAFQHKIEFLENESKKNLEEKDKQIDQLNELNKSLTEEKDKQIDQLNELNKSLTEEKDKQINQLNELNKSLTEEKDKQIDQLNNDLITTTNEYNQSVNKAKEIINSQQTTYNNLLSQIEKSRNTRAWKIMVLLHRMYWELWHKFNPDFFKWLYFRVFTKKRPPELDLGKYEPLNISHYLNDNYNLIIKKTGVNSNKVIYFPRYQNPKVSIIIPVYNNYAYTRQCLLSILNSINYESYEIIIADDLSIDETTRINDFCKNIRVIRTESNVGFLKNCNNAAKQAKGEYILFLNNDTEVKDNWLDELVKVFEKDSKTGIVGSKLIYPDGTLQEAGGIIWNDGTGWNYGRYDDPENPAYNYLKEVDYVSGASLMIKKELWIRIGGFDERYSPAYCEDSDLAFQVRELGYKVIYQPKSVVVHYEGKSCGNDESKGIKHYQVENFKKLSEKWKFAFSKQGLSPKDIFKARDRALDKKTIVVIDHYVPNFDRDAGSQTMITYLRIFLELNFNVKFIPDNFYKQEPYTSYLQDLGIETLYGNHYCNNWQKWIEDNSNSIDFFFLSRYTISNKYINVIKTYTNAKVVYYGHDLHYLREDREKNFSDRLSKKQYLESKIAEIAFLHKVDIACYPSFVEKEILHKEIKNLQIEVIPPYIFDNYNPPIIDFSSRNDILFVGGFAHTPNNDGIKWFVNSIFPRVDSSINDIKLFIIGSSPGADVLDLQSPRIIIKSNVSTEELKEIYSKIRMTIIPLRFGAGIKGKLIETMYYGVPTVSTSIGTEGLRNIDTLIAGKDTPEEFAMELVSLYTNEEALKEKSQKYIDYVKDYTSKENAIKIFKEILR